MTSPDNLDPKTRFIIDSSITYAKERDIVAQRLKETFVRYLVYGHAGGLAACMTIANAVITAKLKAISPSLEAVPLWAFFLGLLASVWMLSLLRAQEIIESETAGQKALQALKDAGFGVQEVESSFPPFMRARLKYVPMGIDGLCTISIILFLVGGVVGLLILTGVR